MTGGTYDSAPDPATRLEGSPSAGDQAGGRNPGQELGRSSGEANH